MKRILYFTFVVILLSFISCENEELTNPHSPDGTLQSYIDSSLLEHNLVLNGHYYQLDFDTAYANIVSCFQAINGIPAMYIMYNSIYKERYTGYKFWLKVSGGQTWFADLDHPNYFTPEVQERFAYSHIYIPKIFGEYYGQYSRFGGGQNNQNIFPSVAYGSGTIDLLSYTYYDTGQDKMLDYAIHISGNNIAGDFSGKFRAQYE